MNRSMEHALIWRSGSGNRSTRRTGPDSCVRGRPNAGDHLQPAFADARRRDSVDSDLRRQPAGDRYDDRFRDASRRPSISRRTWSRRSRSCSTFRCFTSRVMWRNQRRSSVQTGRWSIIAASGMVEAGRILHHLAQGASDPRNTILIVGFQAEHTLGRRIVERAADASRYSATMFRCGPRSKSSMATARMPTEPS